MLRRGRKLADRRLQIERPTAPYFRYTGPGVLRARPKASEPRTRGARIWASVRRAFAAVTTTATMPVRTAPSPFTASWDTRLKS